MIILTRKFFIISPRGLGFVRYGQTWQGIDCTSPTTTSVANSSLLRFDYYTFDTFTNRMILSRHISIAYGPVVNSTLSLPHGRPTINIYKSGKYPSRNMANHPPTRAICPSLLRHRPYRILWPRLAPQLQQYVGVLGV